ncbi:hypothetical protein ACSW29_06970 [Rhodococcus sp. GB-02]
MPVRRRGMCAVLVMAALSVVSCAGERESPPFVSSEERFAFTGRNPAAGPPNVPNLPAEDAPYGAIKLSGAWTGAAKVSVPGSVTCIESGSGDATPTGYRQWTYEVHTSSFYEYDGGGEYPGRDFHLYVMVNESPEQGRSGAIVKFSDQSGEFVSFGISDDSPFEMTGSSDRTRLAIAMTGTAARAGEQPTTSVLSAQISCPTVERR